MVAFFYSMSTFGIFVHWLGLAIENGKHFLTLLVFRDSSGLECDMIISLNDGRWTAVEVKLGTNQIDEAAKHLLKLRDKVNTDKMKEPSFLMILTGGDYAYQRKDGVLVVPVACLKD